MLLDGLEAFYGAAAGGGKSDALLMAALQYADVPGYSALIVRRNVADLALPSARLNRPRGGFAHPRTPTGTSRRTSGSSQAALLSPSAIWRESGTSIATLLLSSTLSGSTS